MEMPSLVSSAERHLMLFNSFLEEHDAKMAKLSHLLKPDQLSSFPKLNSKPVIKLDYSPDKECLSLLRFFDGDRSLNKTYLTFGYLCQEIDMLANEAFKQEMRFIFLDENLLTVIQKEEELIENALDAKRKSKINEKAIICISDSLDFLYQMHNLLQRCFLLGNHIMLHSGNYLNLGFEAIDFKFYDIFEYLCKLLYHMVVVDEILSNSTIAKYWPLYKQSMEVFAKSSQNNGLKKGEADRQINNIQQVIFELDYLVSGTIFQTFLDSLFTLSDKIGAKGFGLLMQQFNEFIKHNLNEMQTISEQNDMLNNKQIEMLIKLNALCVFYHNIGGKTESKTMKTLMEINAKHQSVLLIRNIPWDVLQFLKNYAFILIKSYEKSYSSKAKQYQQQFWHSRLQSFNKDCRHYYVVVTQWSLKMLNCLKMKIADMKLQQFKEIAIVINSGLEYINQINMLNKAIIDAHVTMKASMNRSTVLNICKLLHLIKLIEETYEKQMGGIGKVLQFILQYMQYKMLQILDYCKKKVMSLKNLDENVDALVATKIAEKCLNGPPTALRLFLCKMVLNSFKAKTRILDNEKYEKLDKLMQRMKTFQEFQQLVNSFSVPMFVYFHQPLFTKCFNMPIHMNPDIKLFENLINITNGCKNELDLLSLQHLAITKQLHQSTSDVLKKTILRSLCVETETFLRLESHYNVNEDTKESVEPVYQDFRPVMIYSPIKINNSYIVFKDHIENYLTSMSYNMITISLNDWNTYEKLRTFANHRFDLDPIVSYLPNQSLEQGIDILEIMRNIHIFVAKYVYNMNSQLFMEHSSQANKNLDSISILQISNSLRTHGTGVINTTINFTYQFLKQKFYTFSQFLYDEHIRSRLMKEHRIVSDKKLAEDFPIYSYERADAFNKNIRSLGVTNDGSTYMDLFRKVITHIGNAVGYIRLIKSASIHANYDASSYLPNLKEDLKLLKLNAESHPNETTRQAAANLLAIINNISNSFTENADYFKLLLEAFQPFFQNPKNLHLKNFYLIVPPLTLNYVEHIIKVKENIARREAQESILFDDGFALGIAYILKFLNQIGEFNSLQWFETAKAKFEQHLRKIKEMFDQKTSKNFAASGGKSSAISTEDEKLNQTLALTQRRITALQTEFNLLYYNLCSAKILFI